MEDITIRVRVYEELNRFLDKRYRKREFPFLLKGPSSIEETLSALGVPVEEVELVLINGVSRGRDHILTGGERLSIYPVFERIDISSLIKLRDEPLREIRFLCGRGKGELVPYLRILGFDTLCAENYSMDIIKEILEAEKRIFISSKLHDQKGLIRYIRVEDAYVSIQLKRIFDSLDLGRYAKGGMRCPVCNNSLYIEKPLPICYACEEFSMELWNRIMKFYVYYDTYGRAKKAITEEELKRLYNNSTERFLKEASRDLEDREGNRKGNVGVLMFNDRKELQDFLNSLGDEIEGFYRCKEESRPYNF